MSFIKLKNIPFVPSFLKIFIKNGFCLFQLLFSASIEMVSFLFVLVYKFGEFHCPLNQSCIPEIKPNLVMIILSILYAVGLYLSISDKNFYTFVY